MDDRVGVRRGHMLKIAKNGNVTSKVLLKIHDKTGVNLHWLLTNTGKMGLTLKRDDDDDAASVQRRTSPPPLSPPKPRSLLPPKPQRDSKRTK